MIPARSIIKGYTLVFHTPPSCCRQTHSPNAEFPLRPIRILSSSSSHDPLSMDDDDVSGTGRSRICCFGGAFQNRGKKTSKRSPTIVDEEDPTSGDGGVEILHTSSSSITANGANPQQHLVVMVNGLIGSSTDWKFAAEQFVTRFPDKVVVHCSECNTAKMTFDGVDVMGERLAEEVLAVVRDRTGLHKISFVAHSLGGLVARYAIGRLYESVGEATDGRTQSTGRIAGLQPFNFVTFATPHLGSRGNKQLPFLCGVPFLERQASQTAHFVAGRSGKHLFLTDNDDGKPPLLLRMVSDLDDLKFMSALRSFKRRAVYANANYDHVVGWRTSCIRRQHELPKVDLLLKDKKYPHIVYTEKEIPQETCHQPSSLDAEDLKIDYEEEMIRGLRQVPWERIDVSFHKSRQRYVAHNTIQVKSYWLNSDGADVICHMIDNFLL